MQFQGKIIQVMPEQKGVSQNSGKPWSKIQFVVETAGQYPKKAIFDVFGKEKYAQMPITAGEFVTVDFSVDSHEYNGRWYTSLNALKVEAMNTQTSVLQQPQAPYAQPQQPYAQPVQQPQPIQPQAPDASGRLPF